MADKSTCEWRGASLWESEGVWDTECGHTFYFGEGGPCEDGIDYCCYCGKKIVRIDAVDEIDQVAYGEQVSELDSEA